MIPWAHPNVGWTWFCWCLSNGNGALLPCSKEWELHAEQVQEQWLATTHTCKKKTILFLRCYRPTCCYYNEHLRRAIHEVCLTFCTCLAFAAKAQGWAFICLHSYCSQLHSGKLFVMQLKTCTHLDWWELNVVTNGKAGWKQTARSSAQTSLAPVFVMCYFMAKALLLLVCVKLFTVQLLAK